MNDADLTTFCEPVYKGFIDPTTVLGVPMIPFLLVTTIAAEIGLLGFFLAGPGFLVALAIVYVYVLIWVRGVGANDIQRVRQTLLRAQIRMGQSLSRRHWGSVSYGPSSQRGAQ